MWRFCNGLRCAVPWSAACRSPSSACPPPCWPQAMAAQQQRGPSRPCPTSSPRPQCWRPCTTPTLSAASGWCCPAGRMARWTGTRQTSTAAAAPCTSLVLLPGACLCALTLVQVRRGQGCGLASFRQLRPHASSAHMRGCRSAAQWGMLVQFACGQERGLHTNARSAE